MTVSANATKAATQRNNTITVSFHFEYETTGALRYFEVDKDGNKLDNRNGAAIGTLYLRKSALDGRAPRALSLTIDLGD
jgi:hypothetical protein